MADVTHHPNRGGWSDARVELLAKLWAEGRSGSQIAGRLGGVTRNAVIGKVHRLGLVDRANPRSNHTGLGVVRKRKSRAPSDASRLNFARQRPASPLRQVLLDRSPIPPPATTDIPKVSFLELEPTKHCRWPCIDDPAKVRVQDPQFCGDPRVEGQPYCRDHCRRAFQPPQPRRLILEPRFPQNLAGAPTLGLGEYAIVE